MCIYKMGLLVCPCARTIIEFSNSANMAKSRERVSPGPVWFARANPTAHPHLAAVVHQSFLQHYCKAETMCGAVLAIQIVESRSAPCTLSVAPRAYLHFQFMNCFVLFNPRRASSIKWRCI